MAAASFLLSVNFQFARDALVVKVSSNTVSETVSALICGVWVKQVSKTAAASNKLIFFIPLPPYDMTTVFHSPVTISPLITAYTLAS